jgi:HSP20 family protein
MSAQTATAMQTTKGAAPVRWGVESLFDDIYDSVARRAFELFESNGRWLGRDWADWLQAESEVLHPIPLEVKESDGDYTLRAEVPGFAAKEIEIRVEPYQVSIAGKHETKEEETKKGRTICSELRANQILRTVSLPAHIDTGKVSATLKDGVLTVELPKAEADKSVRIEPKAS